MRNTVDVIEETQKTEQHLLLFSEYAFNGLSALINTVKKSFTTGEKQSI